LAGAFLLRTIGIQDWLILRNYARRKQAEYAGRPDPHELK
jgi:hypothetical protein